MHDGNVFYFGDLNFHAFDCLIISCYKFDEDILADMSEL
jgi:hypothetical protein